MKKNEKKLRRLRLNRETLQILNDPVLDDARGGTDTRMECFSEILECQISNMNYGCPGCQTTSTTTP